MGTKEKFQNGDHFANTPEYLRRLQNEIVPFVAPSGLFSVHVNYTDPHAHLTSKEKLRPWDVPHKSDENHPLVGVLANKGCITVYGGYFTGRKNIPDLPKHIQKYGGRLGDRAHEKTQDLPQVEKLYHNLYLAKHYVGIPFAIDFPIDKEVYAVLKDDPRLTTACGFSLLQQMLRQEKVTVEKAKQNLQWVPVPEAAQSKFVESVTGNPDQTLCIIQCKNGLCIEIPTSQAVNIFIADEKMEAMGDWGFTGIMLSDNNPDMIALAVREWRDGKVSISTEYQCPSGNFDREQIPNYYIAQRQTNRWPKSINHSPISHSVRGDDIEPSQGATLSDFTFHFDLLNDNYVIDRSDPKNHPEFEWATAVSSLFYPTKDEEEHIFQMQGAFINLLNYRDILKNRENWRNTSPHTDEDYANFKEKCRQLLEILREHALALGKEPGNVDRIEEILKKEGVID
jgi:hypothetical protein